MEGQPVQRRQWGVTNAISEAPPSEQDLKLNDQLVDMLKRENNFESPEGTENRVKVLKHLQKVVEEFVRRACRAKGLPASTIDNAGGKIFTFGSYALGVYGPSSDIDTLVVTPKHVSIDDFFDFFPKTFREMSLAEDITEFNPVPDAYVPIIKMEFCGVSIDLIFASLVSLSHVKAEQDLLDTGLLRGLQDAAMRSVNGTRVTKELLESVPQVKSFRHALRAIKLWSNQRGIYGAVFGFPGGVAWAIMVARICQLYPFACGATILLKFFSLMLKWPWPRPILLKNIDPETLHLRQWNPQAYGSDRAHIMPVITPAFPAMCSTHTVMHSTKSIMMDEFKRADEIVNGIYDGKKKWDDLFERHSFFTKDHKYYLSVIASARNKEAHATFSGLVQSKVRLLVKGIEEGDGGVEIARPYVKAFDRVHRCENEEQVDRVYQGGMEYVVHEVDAVGHLPQPNGDSGSIIVYTTTFYIGLTLPKDGTRSLDISYPVNDFKRFVTSSETYDEPNMSVRVVHTRNHQLPTDVFLPGETRPSKPAKEKKKKVMSKSAHKRQFADTGLDDSEKQAVKRRQSANANSIPTPTPA